MWGNFEGELERSMFVRGVHLSTLGSTQAAEQPRSALPLMDKPSDSNQ